jgi:hypothetical protein
MDRGEATQAGGRLLGLASGVCWLMGSIAGTRILVVRFTTVFRQKFLTEAAPQTRIRHPLQTGPSQHRIFSMDR